ncbi:MAG: response regulator [Polyangiales bacterium]
MRAGSPFLCVVDDHESVRDALLALLQSLGYRVATFESAEALCASLALADADCLLLDIHLPGMSGAELLPLLRARHPELPVVLITGRPDAHAHALRAQPSVHALLFKPFEEEQLLDALDAALNGTARATGHDPDET